MNMPNFKDILQKLSVFRNNLSLLVPVIIVLVSVLLFIPTQLMSSRRTWNRKASMRVAGELRVWKKVLFHVSNTKWRPSVRRLMQRTPTR